MHLEGWLFAIALIVGGALVLSHLGVDLGTGLSNLVHGVEHALGRPL